MTDDLLITIGDTKSLFVNRLIITWWYGASYKKIFLWLIQKDPNNYSEVETRAFSGNVSPQHQIQSMYYACSYWDLAISIFLFQVERWHFLPFNPISGNIFVQQCGGSRCAEHYMEWMNTWIGQRPQMGSNPPTTCGAKFFRKHQFLYQKSIYGNIWTTKMEPGPENDIQRINIRKYFANIVITRVGRNLSHLWSRLASLPFPIRHLWIRVFLSVAKNLVIFSKYQQNDLFNDNQTGLSVQW